MTAEHIQHPRVQFRFGRYTVRKVTAADRDLLAIWIEADPDHAGRVLPDFFVRNLHGEDSWAVEDELCRVVLYLKTQVACRLHIQFAPGNRIADRERNGAVLTEGLAWIEGVLQANGFRELCFDSTNTPLILFATRRLGFSQAPDELRRSIPFTNPAGASMPISSPGQKYSEGGA